MRKSFVLYTEWEDAFDGQPNDVAGELIKVIFDYVRTGQILQSDNTIVNAMFSIFRPAIDRNIDKYDAAIEQRKEAGRKSAERRKQQSNENERPLTTVDESTRTSTDSVSVSDSVSEESKDSIIMSEKSKRLIPPTVLEVQNYISENSYSVDADAFVNFYTAKGWLIGKSKMKDWRAAVRTWQRNRKQQKSEEVGIVLNNNNPDKYSNDKLW